MGLRAHGGFGVLDDNAGYGVNVVLVLLAIIGEIHFVVVDPIALVQVCARERYRGGRNTGRFQRKRFGGLEPNVFSLERGLLSGASHQRQCQQKR